MNSYPALQPNQNYKARVISKVQIYASFTIFSYRNPDSTTPHPKFSRRERYCPYVVDTV